MQLESLKFARLHYLISFSVQSFITIITYFHTFIINNNGEVGLNRLTKLMYKNTSAYAGFEKPLVCSSLIDDSVSPVIVCFHNQPDIFVCLTASLYGLSVESRLLTDFYK